MKTVAAAPELASLRYEAAEAALSETANVSQQPPKEQILIVDAFGYAPPPPDPSAEALDALLGEAVALAARDAIIDALAEPKHNAPPKLRRPPPTAFVDPLAAARAAAADAAAAADERLDQLDGFSDEGGDDDDTVSNDPEKEPEDFTAEAAAADAAAADARHAATPTKPKTPQQLRQERRKRRPPSALVELERPPPRSTPKPEVLKRRASSVGSAGGFSEDEADAAPPQVPPPFDDEAALAALAVETREGALVETARMCLLPSHQILVRRRQPSTAPEQAVTLEAARALAAQRRLARQIVPPPPPAGVNAGDRAGHVQELILDSRGDDVEAALAMLIERKSDDARQVCVLVCCALRAGALTRSLVSSLEAWLRSAPPTAQSGAVATAVLQARCAGLKALGGARLCFVDETAESSDDEPLGELAEACDWAAFEETGGLFELAFPGASDDADGWQWDEAAVLTLVGRHATCLRYDAALEAVARRDFRRAADAVLRAAHRDGAVAAACRALDALLDSGASPQRVLAPRDDLASPRAPLVLAFLRADTLARRGALVDGVPNSLRSLLPVDDVRVPDDVLERPRWRPWDDGVEAWLAAPTGD